MTKQIEKLTPEQEARFPEFVDKWIKIGTSTEPVDLEKAKAAACKAYRLAGLPEPTQFHLVDSPVAAIDLIKKLDPEKDSREIISEMIYGYNDASWLSFYNYFQEVVGIESCNDLQGLFDLAETSGWLNVYEDVVVFQHRPEIIKFDDEKRLHREDGPAIRFRDGFSIYAWHGTRIPAEWIEDKENSLTAQVALTWPNVEQRRCACEILGWATVLKQLNSKVIDKDGDPEIGELVEVDIPEIGRERFLRVLCGTGREFALPVPPNMKTALEANAWTYGFDVEEFGRGPEIRT